MEFSGTKYENINTLAYVCTYPRAVTKADSLARFEEGIAVYDWLLCFNREQQFILSRGISQAKIAYTLCRYWPLVAHPIIIWVTVVDHEADRDFCRRTIRLPMILQIGNFVGVGSILILRVHAFIGGILWITWFLVACLLGDVAYQLWVSIAKTGYDPNVGCHPVNVGKAKHMGGYITAPLLFDSIAFTLTMLYAFQGTPKGTWRLRGSFYTRIFLRDGIAYFVAIMIVHGVNVVLNSQPDEALRGASIPSSLILPNIMACRLFLHLRHASPPVAQTAVGSTAVGFGSGTALRTATVSSDMDDMDDQPKKDCCENEVELGSLDGRKPGYELVAL
ncbi:hypothetical protein AURDEDRAFT_161590 [Auricularia subglabra TFB-10046 SS5]|nr:hypothetical protein AURDEDRAFT_161590 [Auricularia subglabra TFB-10046 SS5]